MNVKNLYIDLQILRKITITAQYALSLGELRIHFEKTYIIILIEIKTIVFKNTLQIIH